MSSTEVAAEPQMDPRVKSMLGAQQVTCYVRPVMWVGQCPRCGEDAPEMRHSAEEAQRDIDECACRYEDEQAGVEREVVTVSTRFI